MPFLTRTPVSDPAFGEAQSLVQAPARKAAKINDCLFDSVQTIDTLCQRLSDE